jgi:hypothetical protein
MFSSDRTGTLGGQDIYVATRDSTTDPWSPPVTLGGCVVGLVPGTDPRRSAVETTREGNQEVT